MDELLLAQLRAVRRADPPAPAGAVRARRVLRERALRDPRPVAAAPVAPPAAAGGGRAAGARRPKGANVYFPLPARRRPGPRAARPPAGGRRRSWPPTAARPRAWRPSARARRPRASARKGADWDEMRALGLPAAARSRRRCCDAAAGAGRPPARHRHRHGPAAGTGGARVPTHGAGRRCQPRHAGAGPRAPGRARPGRTAPCARPTCTACRWPTPASTS